MIYIDPPYNIGNEFVVYHDDFAELQAKSHVPMYIRTGFKNSTTS